MADHINDELTRGVYKNLCLQQKPEVKEIFPVLFNQLKPLRVIEIGTGHGGLSMFIRDILPPSSDFYSFDIADLSYHNSLRENNIKMYNENIYVDDVKDWNRLEVKPEWREIFNITPKLVLCDGGHKKGEFNGLAKYLSMGDIIMLHDYCTDESTFENIRVWNWLECKYSDISAVCEECNLQPYMHQEFLNVAWGCFIKQ
jgi:cephalosporin hydroxylase